MNGPPGAANRRGTEVPVKVTPDIAAEAALWVARLHGPDRNQAMEREFRGWQARSAAHREAFERCTDTWQDVSRINLATAYETVALSRASESSRRLRGATGWLAAAAGLAVMLAGGGWLFQSWRAHDIYSTAIGELRSIALDDGSRMLLNTDTQVRVDYGASQRTVAIARGEALFDVAKDAGRPFVVRVAGSEVVAVGTSFSVRFVDGPKDKDALSVTLIEGRVNVRPAGEGGPDALAPQRVVTLQPGDRLQLDHRAHGGAIPNVSGLDRPNVEQALAWKRNEAVFQDASLADAVEEMNRYSKMPIVLVGGDASARLHVSGLFRTGDSVGFARAVAALHGLRLRETDGRLELANVR